LDQQREGRNVVKVISEVQTSEKVSEPFGKIKKVVFPNDEAMREVGQLRPVSESLIHS
jgi:hypothetical protein